jgi:hypothetical protein
MYHVYSSKSEETLRGVDLNTSLSYADRWRNRKAGSIWGFLPPHVDGARIHSLSGFQELVYLS